MLGCRRSSLFLLGAGVGAVAGLLLAPKPGREIRQELFGGASGFPGGPDADTEVSPFPDEEQDQQLKAKIEETRARLKADIETFSQD